MRTSHEQLLQWMAEPEGQRLEFKEAKSTYSLDKLAPGHRAASHCNLINQSASGF